MPPRLQLPCISRLVISRNLTHSTAATFLQPFLQQAQQCRSASILSSLSDNAGAYNKRIRRGRGPSSGKGKTSGRGHKGQKQHGSVPRAFNGGQTKDEVVAGARGFENQFSIEMSPINVDRIQAWIDKGRLDPSQPITIKELDNSRCLHGIKDGVKLMARGASQLTTPINIIVSRASAAAIEAVEKAGGSVTTRYYTKPSIIRVLKGQSDPFISLQSKPLEISRDDGLTAAANESKYPFRLPDPTSRKDLEYYRDPAHRGYLSHTMQEGEGPSLFFKVPGAGRLGKKKIIVKGGKVVAKGENRLW